MNIRIPKELYEENEAALKAKPFNIKGHNIHYKGYVELSLSRYSVETLEKLKELLYSRTLRGSGVLQKDIQNWIEAISSGDKIRDIKARSLKQAHSLLIQYVRRFPNKWVFEKESKGAVGITCPYYIYKIEYCAPYSSRGDSPPYVAIRVAWEVFGLRKTYQYTFQGYDAVGKTPHEILTNLDLMPETKGLREDYAYYMENYVAWKDQVGMQFWAVGCADDEDIDTSDDDTDESRHYWWRSAKNFILDLHGVPTRCVIDVFQETDEEKTGRDKEFDPTFWSNYKDEVDDDFDYSSDDSDDDENEENLEVTVPAHPYVAIFDLKRHRRLRLHVGNMEPYEYDKEIAKNLILPQQNLDLIDTLLVEKETKFQDVIKGKTGGIIILCQGKPGTGKTLTAEIYSELLGRPLYTVQCSQLGMQPKTLETNLLKVFTRARRWGAITLIDEADVYVHERGSDLVQNAIVGVFLRVLEYQSGVLFMTTNRQDLVDDAILSRCTARIPYTNPTTKDQEDIWRVLARSNDIDLADRDIRSIVKKHPNLSGRDVKNLLKLGLMVAERRGVTINEEIITEVKQFKPTMDD